MAEEETERAVAVVEAVREGGFLEPGMYAYSENIEEEADYWLKEAQAIYEAGVDEDLREPVEKILTVGKIEFDPKPAYQSGIPPRSSGGYTEADLRSKEETTEKKSKKDEELDEDFARAVEKDSDTYRENLPIPAEVEGEAEPMPRDLTKLKDVDVRRLSGEYNAFLARATWLLAVELSDLANAEHLLEAHYQKALIQASLPASDGAKKLRDVIEAEARANADVEEWTIKVDRHKGEAMRLRALKDIYAGHIDRLSREWTMRTDEYERSS